MTKKAIALLKSTIKNDDVLDEKTGHIFREVNGDIAEYKFCKYCKEWCPVEDFAKNPKSIDRLHSYSRKGISLYRKERKQGNKGQATIEQIETPRAYAELEEAEMKTQSKLEAIEEMIASLKEDEEQKGKEITLLRAENKKLAEQAKDLSNLPEKDIKSVLANNKIPLRFLFEAIARLSGDRYTFFAIDKETGLPAPIKTKEEVSAYIQCA